MGALILVVELVRLAEELVESGGVGVQMKHRGAELSQKLVAFSVWQTSLPEPPDERGDVLTFLSKLTEKDVNRTRLRS